MNRERKECKAKFYKSRVQDLKGENPKVWWKEIKRISGMHLHASDLRNHLNVSDVEDLSAKDLANAINKAFLEPLEEYRLPEPLSQLPLEDSPSFLEVSEEKVDKVLSNLNPNKACGPDGISNWLLKEFSVLLAAPLTRILNSSYREQLLPKAWKLADVPPLPKKKPVEDLNKDLRPISLTPCISKIAEEFVVNDYVKPAVMRVVHTNQYGAIPKSSTTHALLSMIHDWSAGTDGNGAAVRAILFDYRKAFDLIDHNILVHKLRRLILPHSIINWITDFLRDRSQRIKLANNCYSEWGSVPSGVPQGTKLGPWLFLIMINDLVIPSTSVWKFVDDTTVSEIINKNQASEAQSIADEVVQWSEINRMQLNADKCKELRISFAKHHREFSPIIVNSKCLDVVTSVKLLGLTISNDLTWNVHINDLVKKASKRLYFLVQLKRANVLPHDLVLFYIACIRSILDYAVPVFYYSLPNYLGKELERIQKRALGIIFPNLEYHKSLEILHIERLSNHHKNICIKMFNEIANDVDHNIHHLIPDIRSSSYNIRKIRKFAVPQYKTNRFANSFFIASCQNISV